MKYTFKTIDDHSLDLEYTSTANRLRDRLSSNIPNYFSHMAGAIATDNLAAVMTGPGWKELFIFVCMI